MHGLLDCRIHATTSYSCLSSASSERRPSRHMGMCEGNDRGRHVISYMCTTCCSTRKTDLFSVHASRGIPTIVCSAFSHPLI